jgi:arginine deiminase
MSLHVTSEFGRLREAIVHRPGQELVRMTPSTRDYFVFDDLLYDDPAREEHDWLTDLLQNHLGVKVHFLESMLAEALASASGPERKALISQVCRLESGMPPVEQRIGQLEVLVRWFQGSGWPQYTQDPEGHPHAAASGALPGALESVAGRNLAMGPAPASDHNGEEFDYSQYRLESWSDAGDYGTLAEELIQGIEAWVPNTSPGDTADRTGEPGAGAGGTVSPPAQARVGDVDTLRRYVEGRLFYLTPVPNLMFVGDVAAVVNDRLLPARMAVPGRAREPLLLDFIQRHHPRFKDTFRWNWAGADTGDPGWPAASSPMLYLEGGNVLQLRDDLLVLAVNQRTSIEAVQRAADAWRTEAIKAGKKIVLYVLRLPAGLIHLDTVLGVISYEDCIVYSPVFEPYGPASVDVVRAELGPEPVSPTRSADFFSSLRDDGVDLRPISCGGSEPVDQQREQWFSGCNLLAVAPGKVVVFRSTERTIDELSKRGYRIVDITEVQTGAVKLDLDSPGKWALKIKGSELSRAHGGPHSLVLPLVRD